MIKSPTKTFTNRCKHCGRTVSRTVPNKELEFKDKLQPILKKYGKIIFKGDAKTKLIAKSVKVRNKVDHVNANIVGITVNNADIKNVISNIEPDMCKYIHIGEKAFV